jgi:hypothetical protein
MFLRAHWCAIAATDFFSVEVLTLSGLVRKIVGMKGRFERQRPIGAPSPKVTYRPLCESPPTLANNSPPPPRGGLDRTERVQRDLRVCAHAGTENPRTS